MRATPRVLLLIALAAAPARAAGDAALKTIRSADVSRHLWNLAAPALEGRDTPSAGLDRAEEYVARRFAEAGLAPWGELTSGSDGAEPDEEPWRAFLWGWSRQYEAPDLEGSELVAVEDGEEVALEAGRDFLPVLEFGGSGSGEVTFVGFGIRSRRERFDELRGVDLRGRIAVVLEGEPAHRRLFDGEEVTAAASFWGKVEELASEKAAGVLLVRRPIEGTTRPETVDGAPFTYRYGWARWQAADNDRIPALVDRLPVLEVTAEAAERVVGKDVWELGRRIERGGKPRSFEVDGVRVRLDSRTTWVETRVDNVCGVVRGTDPEVAGEYVVVGAHHDHVGVDTRGRVAPGADDNASGTAAVVELAAALAADPPRRSVLLVTFSGEEDGLLGSRAFCEDLPVPTEALVAMVNLDMVGRGERDEVAVIGTDRNPDLRRVVERARREFRTGVKKVDFAGGDPDGLFQRSDHFSFHQIGVPSLFLFEGLPISRNRDYHTWRDVVEAVDPEKVARAARLAYGTAWLLASDDERPGKPRR